jgi:transglutaminase-like putative cysteine protease
MESSGHQMNRRPDPPWLLAIGELSLLAVTLTAWAGFSRVLSGNWVTPVVVMALVAHLIVGICRRRDWPVVASAAVTAVVGIPAVLWISLPGATTAGIPGPGTQAAASDALTVAWESLRSEVAPVSVQPGLLLVVGVAVFLAVFLADWAAFRLWATGEAVVPAVTVFVFTILVGDNSNAVATASAFAGAVAIFLLVHHQAKMAATERWMTDQTPRPGGVLVTGVALVALAVIAGSVAGPALPGANDPALVDWAGSDGGRGGQRITVSPLVDIRGRLVEQSDELLFTVDATQPAYWRLTSLETFDGGIWKSTGSYRPVSGPLDGDDRTTAATTTVEQRFDMVSLAAVWLPAAWQPSAVEADTDVRWHRQSGTLMVDSDVDTSDGLTYAVTSEVPTLDPAGLRAAGGPPPDDIAGTYLQLPDEGTAVAERVARGLVANATNDYDRARLLQDWFATEFTYDLSAPPGHDGDAIDAFLARRSGYCEQFAGTFAVMARTLGIPARVAVGFTPGEADPADPSLLLVRGEHAHAWPEVWLNGFGWVAFEPTPGRGAPGAEAWTGRPALQSDGDQVSPPPTAAPEPESPTSPTDPTNTAPAPTTPAPPANSDQQVMASGDGAAPSGGSLWPWLALAVALAALWLTVVWAATGLERRRRLADQTPQGRADTAWWSVTTALATAGLRRTTTETTWQFVERATTHHRNVGEELSVVAACHEAIAFGQHPPEADDVDLVEQAAATVCDSVTASLTRRQRLGALVNPAPLATLFNRRRTTTDHRRDLVGSPH